MKTNQEQVHLLYKDEELTEHNRLPVRISDELKNLLDGRDCETHSAAQTRLFDQINEQISSQFMGQFRGPQQDAQMQEALRSIMLRSVEEASYMPYRLSEEIQVTVPLIQMSMSINLDE